MKKIKRYDNYKLIPIPPQCTTTQCEFKRVSDNEKCTVSIKDLDQLERERDEAIDCLISVHSFLLCWQPVEKGGAQQQFGKMIKEVLSVIEKQELKEMKG